MYVNKTYNELDVSVTLQRRKLCDIQIALLSAYERSNSDHWLELHDEISAILRDFDDANFEAYRRANNAVV